MMKAVGTYDSGRKLLLLGLSLENLDKLRTDGTDGFIHIKGEDLGYPGDVIITAGSTEALYEAFHRLIGPDTKVHISEKLKS